MKAVIYARYSCDRQNEQSIEGQLHECYAYAEKHDITIVKEYIDRALSGRSAEHRSAFQQMIKDSDKKGFDFVIVYKIDRFARNRYDSAMYKAKLKRNNVKVLYAKESIPEGPEGIILESLLEGMAEYYSAELSQKIKRGIHEIALKHKAYGGNRPFGYRIDSDKNFVIDEKEAEIVRKIFTDFADGKQAKEIAAELNEKGIKNARGTSWNKNNFFQIFHNEKYIGVYKLGDYRQENVIPRIVSDELWNRVQKLVEKHKQAPASGRDTEYHLTGKAYCGNCGTGLQGGYGTSKTGDRHYYYSCSARKRHRSCNFKPVTKEWLESTVVDVTVKNILQDDIIDLIASRCEKISAAEHDNQAERNILQLQLASVNKSLSNVMRAIEEGIITSTTKQRLNELEEQKAKLEFELTELEVIQLALSKKQIVYMLTQFKADEDAQLTEEYRKDLIECFVNSVYVYEDKLIITYNLLQREKAELFSIEHALNSSTLIFNGGQSETKVELRYYNYTLLMCLMLQKHKK